MKAIILAAGRGSRMKDATDDRPKCLVEFRGKALLDWQLEALSGAGIKSEDIAVVTGYRAELLEARIGQTFNNPRWAETNMVASLRAAHDWLSTEDCLVSYSDLYYPTEAVAAILASPEATISLTYDYNWLEKWTRRFSDPLLDCETFRIDDNNVITEIGQKPEAVEDIQGQFMGLIRFRPQGWTELIRVHDEMTGKTHDKIDMTGILQKTIEAGRIDILGVRYGGNWGEFDSQDDIDAVDF